MKIVVATQGKGGLEDQVSPVFGRAPTFTIVEVENEKIGKVEVKPNPSASAFGGAGIQAAQFIANQGAKVVIAGNFGPNASMVLNQAGIEVFISVGKVREAVEDYLKSSKTMQATQAIPAVPRVQEFKPSKLDIEFEKKMLELQKQMIEEEIKYLEAKIKELQEK